MTQRVHIISLGCPKNRVDSEVMVGLLGDRDFSMVERPEEAEVIIVNTCSFIRPATEESIDTVLEMAGHKNTGHCEKLVVTGCMVQRYGQALEDELPEVDHFLGTGEYHRITEVLEARQGNMARSFVDTPMYIHDEMAPRLNSWKPHSAYLKISEGCDHRCAFCIIPQLRGKMRSRTIPSLVSEASKLVQQGVVELNLVSQDSTAFGRDLGAGQDLGALLRALSGVDGLEWLRLHYAYPIGLPESLLQAIAEEDKIVPYLDMPLQHVSGRILKSMRRGVTREGQERILDRVRKYVPDISIRTTFIVGFPGESEQEFEELLDFVREQRFCRVGAFTYFEEDGTPAAELPDQVPEEVRQERQDRLMRTQAPISLEANQALVGQTLRVLVDGPSEENDLVLSGRLANQAPDIDGQIFLDEAPSDVKPGQFRQVRVTRVSEYDLVGQVVGHSAMASSQEITGRLQQ